MKESGLENKNPSYLSPSITNIQQVKEEVRRVFILNPQTLGEYTGALNKLVRLGLVDLREVENRVTLNDFVKSNPKSGKTKDAILHILGAKGLKFKDEVVEQ